MNIYSSLPRKFRPLSSVNIGAKVKQLSHPELSKQYLINNNPRNLENLRIAYKPSGYHLENLGRSYWHKLELTLSQRFVNVSLIHFENKIVLSASTSEYSIKNQLNKTRDTRAFINLARVFAQRCHEAGLIEMRSEIKSFPNGKIDKFLQTLKENGISIIEPSTYKPTHLWDNIEYEKPWEVEDKCI